MTGSYAILISSCEKFSDLWEWNIRLLYEHWDGRKPPIYLVTDKPTKTVLDGVTILCFDTDFPHRIKLACEAIRESYVLLTLDDYFLIRTSYEANISYLVDYCQKSCIDYMLLYDRRFLGKKDRLEISDCSVINTAEKYSINLYPAIWNKDFLHGSVKAKMTPWEYEVSLSKYGSSVGANCCFNHAQAFYILDVVRKGKILNNAHKYLKSKGITIGNREIISIFEEIKLYVMFYINWHCPCWLKRFVKKVAVKLGMKFYSTD